MTTIPLADRRTAVYRLFNAEGALLYVGISCDTASRFGKHSKDKDWWPEVAGHAIEWHRNRAEALGLESQLIVNEKPIYNKALNPNRPRQSRAQVARRVRTGRGRQVKDVSAVAASPLDLEIAKVLHAALGMLLARHGVTPISNPKPLLYSPKEAAVRLGLESVNQLYRRTSDGTWPYTPIGGLTKFSESDLEQIIKIQARDTAKKSNRKSALA